MSAREGAAIDSKRERKQRPGKDPALESDAWDLHEAMSELVRVYQFRDRTRICYYDLSVTQCYAVGALVSRGPMTLNGLAAELYLDKSTTSRVVDSLEQKAYVRRTADPGDGRALRLEVTAKGQKLHSRIEDDLVKEMKGLLEEFDPDVRRATTRLVERLARVARGRFSKAGIRRDTD